jgi:hypothetical protein
MNLAFEFLLDCLCHSIRGWPLPVKVPTLLDSRIIKSGESFDTSKSIFTMYFRVRSHWPYQRLDGASMSMNVNWSIICMQQPDRIDMSA